MSDVTPSPPVDRVTATNAKAETAYEAPDHQDKEERDSSKEEAPEEERRVEDVAMILGIPASDVTPQIQQGLNNVMNEFNRQRRELDYLRKRVAFLEKRGDAHPYLPIMSRHALERALTKVLNRADQAQTENSFACFQFEGLEAVRCRQGLSTADGIVATVANAIKSSLRASDIFGSMGGYGLGVIFTVTAAADAEKKAAALVESAEDKIRGSYPSVRLRFGIHPLTAHETVANILAAADADLRRRNP